MQRQKPPPRALADPEHGGREADEHDDERALDQDAGGDAEPEQHDRRAGEFRPVPAQIGAGEAMHRGDGAGGQHRIGLGEVRLDHQQDRRGHQGRRDECAALRDEGERRPIGQEHRRQRAEERGNAVESDRGARRRHAEGLRKADGGALEPVDADRLLVPGLVLEADVDEVTRLEHLLRRLRVARLVPVHRLQRGEARQEAGEREEHEDGAEAQMRRFGVAQGSAHRLQRPGATRRFRQRGALRVGEAGHRGLRVERLRCGRHDRRPPQVSPPQLRARGSRKGRSLLQSIGEVK